MESLVPIPHLHHPPDHPNRWLDRLRLTPDSHPNTMFWEQQAWETTIRLHYKYSNSECTFYLTQFHFWSHKQLNLEDHILLVSEEETNECTSGVNNEEKTEP